MLFRSVGDVAARHGGQKPHARLRESVHRRRNGDRDGGGAVRVWSRELRARSVLTFLLQMQHAGLTTRVGGPATFVG